jgi:KaiC/GvpD/RAD55 family RecA-like ATPase
MPQTLRFGIESLDKLIGVNQYDFGLNISKGDEQCPEACVTTSICLTGPDGTGKSVLGLHLAARYMADCFEEREAAPDAEMSAGLPKVLYISTDLTHSMAQRVWENFDLSYPSLREEPFNVNEPRRRVKKGLRPVSEELELRKKTPEEMGRVLSCKGEYAVYFVDLAQETVGDDWGFVHHLLSVMDRRDEGPRDLVLLDAVEGFEMLVGDINAFGDKATRRSRIAQVMRLVADKCHLLFVVEEVKDERLPEEFVTDSVIRLRNIDINGYVRRTVEVEKTRGQTHVRGQHPFVIRDGSGSTTGHETYENHDDPRVLQSVVRGDGHKKAAEGNKQKKEETQSYVQVFHSINNLSRELMVQRGDPKSEPPTGKYAAFGIPYLDTILGGEGELALREGSDTRGLPCSSVTALIGDALTNKSLLGRAFLSRTFYPFASALAEAVEGALPRAARKGFGRWSKQHSPLAEFKQEVERAAGELKRQNGSKKILGVALMMTTQDTNVEALSKEFIRWLNPKGLLGIRGEGHDEFGEVFAKVLREYVVQNTICRRMEVHDLSSPVLAHIFRRNIEAAQMRLLGKSLEQLPTMVSDRYKESWRIRMVIDDFNAFRNTFPDIHNDPLLLPFLLLQFGREGISTLIIDTQSGKPDFALAERFESSLREAADYRLYTWRIPFYGETRIAITAIPPVSMKSRGLIRELSGQGMHAYLHAEDEREDRQLTVDPHLELYAGLERGNPHPVPLEVRLYPGTATLVKYIEEENVFFSELFVPNAPKIDVIIGFQPPHYESLREFCYLQRDTRLDHTLVFQVDEFWLTWLTRQSLTRKGGVLQRQGPYLDTVTVDRNGEPDPAADAYHLFQKTFYDMKYSGDSDGEDNPLRDARDRDSLRRRDFYDDERLEYGFSRVEEAAPDEPGGGSRRNNFEEIDRVPFLWDFAFLLCRENLWREYIDSKHHEAKAEKCAEVKRVWVNLRKAKEEERPGGEPVRKSPSTTRREPPRSSPPSTSA